MTKSWTLIPIMLVLASFIPIISMGIVFFNDMIVTLIGEAYVSLFKDGFNFLNEDEYMVIWVIINATVLIIGLITQYVSTTVKKELLGIFLIAFSIIPVLYNVLLEWMINQKYYFIPFLLYHSISAVTIFAIGLIKKKLTGVDLE